MTAVTGEARHDVTAPAGQATWRRLSPRMLVIHPIVEVGRAIPALLGLLVAGSSSGHGGVWSLAAVGVLVTMAVLRWFTTTYRVTSDRVQVRRGLLRRRVTGMSRDRVRTVDVTSHWLHRLLGLARVTLGTGRSDRNDGGAVRLDALTVLEAERLRDELLHRGPVADATAALAPPETELARLAPEWIRYGPFTLSGVVAIGVVAGFLANAAREANVDLSRHGPLQALFHHLGGQPLAVVVAEVALVSLLIVALASTAAYALAFWKFRLARRPNGTLHVTRGLLTTRATTIEERRLHGVELSEPLLLRAVRGARAIAIATGLRVGRGAERGGSLLLPPAPRAEAERVAAEVLRAREPITVPLAPHGPRARRRRFARALAGAAAVIAALAALSLLAGLTAWAWAAAALALPPAAAALAADRYRSLGHTVVAGTLVARRGTLVRRRYALRCDGIIGWNVRQTLFQRRAGLATLSATTAAGRQRYDVQDVGGDEVVRIAEAAVPGLLEPFLA
jgi:putative membrane protein